MPLTCLTCRLTPRSFNRLGCRLCMVSSVEHAGPPGEEVEIDLLLTVPAGAQPDTVHTSTLTATAQNDTTRSDTIDVDVAASMVTELDFTLSSGFARWRPAQRPF